jgi:hypothetical protein
MNKKSIARFIRGNLCAHIWAQLCTYFQRFIWWWIIDVNGWFVWPFGVFIVNFVWLFVEIILVINKAIKFNIYIYTHTHTI